MRETDKNVLGQVEDWPASIRMERMTTHGDKWTYVKVPHETPGKVVVYLAYAHSGYDYCRELVGIYASKASAYRAARKRQMELIMEHWEVYDGDRRWREDYRASWCIAEVKVQP
jgi:hypothetical protein